jgi:hypothetical protein
MASVPFYLEPGYNGSTLDTIHGVGSMQEAQAHMKALASRTYMCIKFHTPRPSPNGSGLEFATLQGQGSYSAAYYPNPGMVGFIWNFC